MLVIRSTSYSSVQTRQTDLTWLLTKLAAAGLLSSGLPPVPAPRDNLVLTRWLCTGTADLRGAEVRFGDGLMGVWDDPLPWSTGPGWKAWLVERNKNCEPRVSGSEEAHGKGFGTVRNRTTPQ
jgi:hypothetical protein